MNTVKDDKSLFFFCNTIGKGSNFRKSWFRTIVCKKFNVFVYSTKYNDNLISNIIGLLVVVCCFRLLFANLYILLSSHLLIVFICTDSKKNCVYTDCKLDLKKKFFTDILKSSALSSSSIVISKLHLLIKLLNLIRKTF